MAAYAAIVSLMTTIRNIQNHSRLSTSIDKGQIESLGEKLDFLLDFVENHHSHGGNTEAEFLENQIASVAHAAEGVIQSHIVGRIEPLMARSTTFDPEENSSILLLDFLWNMLQIIENRPSLLTSTDRNQIESLGEKLDLLLDIIENRDSHAGSKEAEVLENQIGSEALSIKDAFDYQSREAEFDSDDKEIRPSVRFDYLFFIMEQILNHPPLWTSLCSEEADFFYIAIDFLQCFIDTTSDGNISEEDKDLERQFAEYADESQEAGSASYLQKQINAMKKKVIKVHKIFEKKVVFAGSENSFLPNLQKILEDMDSLKEKVIKVREERGFKDVPPTHSMPAASSSYPTIGKTSVVGFESYVVQLLDWLTAEQSDQQIIPITGMGGIGKTTLARKVYDDLLVVHHFDVRAWLTISQHYNIKELLFHTLSHLGKSTEELDNKTEAELGVLLHKFLYGRRYLIILDDMWSIECWDKIRFYFPREEKRSRVVVTTRQSDVANHFGYLRLALNFLDDDRSWDLFCEKAFEQGCCPSELEIMGRKIVKKCKGLPLSIIVIGGLLGKSSRTQEHWENVEKDLSSILSRTEDNQCFNILSLSYNHLPAHLKPCFLYLGIFPEDHVIHVSRLIQLWVAEGFLNPNKDQCLEEIAKGYIEDLVGRNLLLVRSLSLNRKVKTFCIHDLLREFCIKVAEKEKFFCSLKDLDSPRDTCGERRLISIEIMEEGTLFRSFRSLQSITFEHSVTSETPALSLSTNAYGYSLDTALQQVNLRFLNCNPSIYHNKLYSYHLPSSISLLWNLQTLIIEGFSSEVVAPSEIWEMQQLRLLQICKVFLPKPPLCDKQDRIVLRNLQTLRVAHLDKWSVEVCKRIPNIKKLRMTFVNYVDGLHNLVGYSGFCYVGRLTKLESLHFDSGGAIFSLQDIKLPVSLKKLSLRRCKLNWDDLTIIGLLPQLEVLKLNRFSVVGVEWNPIEGGFLRLKDLKICQCKLTHWNADSSHFPVLENLYLESLSELDEIPPGIGDIPTLGEICLQDCSVSASHSVVNLLKEQESFGNEDLQVRVVIWNDKEIEELRAKIEMEGLASHNIRVSTDMSFSKIS